MQLRWGIPEETEKPFRKALDHASKRREHELHDLLDSLPEQQLGGAIGLCAIVTAYMAIDVTERRWPSDAALREMAGGIVKGRTSFAEFGVTEENAYRWLAQCVFSFRDYSKVFGDLFDDPHEFLATPFFLTVKFLAAYVPEGQTIWEFLELIEDSYEKAFLLDLNLLPALMVRARMEKAANAKAENGGSGGDEH